MRRIVGAAEFATNETAVGKEETISSMLVTGMFRGRWHTDSLAQGKRAAKIFLQNSEQRGFEKNMTW